MGSALRATPPSRPIRFSPWLVRSPEATRQIPVTCPARWRAVVKSHWWASRRWSELTSRVYQIDGAALPIKIRAGPYLSGQRTVLWMALRVWDGAEHTPENPPERISCGGWPSLDGYNQGEPSAVPLLARRCRGRLVARGWAGKTRWAGPTSDNDKERAAQPASRCARELPPQIGWPTVHLITTRSMDVSWAAHSGTLSARPGSSVR